MVLTTKQVEAFKDGKLNKTTFIKLLGCDEIDNYLYRYCYITEDVKTESNLGFHRSTSFEKYNVVVTLDFFNGECVGKRWKICG